MIRPGDANIDRAAVTLPSSIILDQSNIRTVCTRPQWAADECPDAAIYGWARAWSPLLAEPVKGPVYLRSSDDLLPNLVADLQGQVDIVLVGKIVGTPDGRMRTQRGTAGLRTRASRLRVRRPFHTPRSLGLGISNSR